MTERSPKRPPTGPAPAAEEEVTEIPLVLDGSVRRRRLDLSAAAEARRSPDDGAHTRKIDTKPLVSAAFEEDDPSEELGFDKPLFTGELEEELTPQGLAPITPMEGTTGDSVVVDMDFDGEDVDDLDDFDDVDAQTPSSLWSLGAAPGDGDSDEATTGKQLAPPPAQTPAAATAPVRRERPRPATGPQPLSRHRRPSAELGLPPMGSARKKDRISGTGRLPQQNRSAGASSGGGRAWTYVIVGALVGLGAGLFFGLYHSGGDDATKGEQLSARGAAAVAQLAARRSVTAAERRALSELHKAMDRAKWSAARGVWDALPARLRDDVAVRGWLGRIQRGAGQLQASIATLKPLPGRAPAAAMRVELQIELAESYLAAKQLPRARAAAQRAKQELGADASEALASRVVRLLKRCTAP
jgi:hypothetical protein